MTHLPVITYKCSVRRGFSIIELLVTLGIIFTLAGLMIPAVQAAREAGRKAQCMNNLAGMIRATHSFASTWEGFPPASTTILSNDVSGGSQLTGIFATHCRLLPYLEQSDLFNGINFDLHCNSVGDLYTLHGTIATHRVGIFLCPSDSYRYAATLAPTSYRANIGVEQTQTVGTTTFAGDDGPFQFMRPILPLSAITDGLSNTLAFSEKPIGTGMGAYSPFNDWVVLPLFAASADQWLTICSGISSTGKVRLDSGATWVLAGAIYTDFIASAPPDTPIADCGSMLNNGNGIFAVRSYHPAGCNAAMADGSVRTFAAGVPTNFWRSLGTRNGGEVTP